MAVFEYTTLKNIIICTYLPMKTAIQRLDIFSLSFLQSAKISPAGDQIVYSLLTSNPKQGLDHKTLWLYSLLGKESEQLTFGTSDFAPSWSPDGTYILFLSENDSGVLQFYRIFPDGSGRRAFHSVSSGITGSYILSEKLNCLGYTSLISSDKSYKNNAYRLSQATYRYDGFGLIDNMRQGIYLVSLLDGSSHCIQEGSGIYELLQWSPVNNSFLFFHRFSSNELHDHPKLGICDTNGTVDYILPDWGILLNAAFFPSGEKLAFIGRPHEKNAGTKFDLWTVNRDGTGLLCRTGNLPEGVGSALQGDMPTMIDTLFCPSLFFSPDNQFAYVSVQLGGTLGVYQVSLAGEEYWEGILCGARSCVLVDSHEKNLLFFESDINVPIDLKMLSLNTKRESILLAPNLVKLSKHSLPVVQKFSFQGSENALIDGWFLPPPFGKKPYPTVLCIHGGPHIGFGHIFSCDFQVLCQAGFGVLFINQRGSTGYGDSFATRIIGDWGNLDAKDLLDALDFTIQQGIVDPNRLGCFGLSGGGFLTCWLVGTTSRFQAAVAENPLTNWISFYGTSDIGHYFSRDELGGLPHEILEVYQRCSPITYAHRVKTPTLLIQGEDDHRCPPEQSEQFYRALLANGCQTEMLRLPKSAHMGSILGDFTSRSAQNEALLSWMERYLLSTP